MSSQKLDHMAVKQRWLLNLTGVACAIDGSQFAAGDALLQCKRSLMRVVLASSDDDGRTGNFGMVIVRLRLPVGLELGDDGSDIAEHVATGKQVGEEMCHRRRPESGAKVLEGIAPAVADALLLIGLDPWWNEVFLWIVAGAAHDHRCRLLRPVVVHPRQHR